MEGEFQNINMMQWEVTTSLPDEIGVKVLFQFKTVSARCVSHADACGLRGEELCVPGPGHAQSSQYRTWCYNCPECGGWGWSVIKLWYQPSFILTSRPPHTDLWSQELYLSGDHCRILSSSRPQQRNQIQGLNVLNKRLSGSYSYRMGQQFDWISDGWLTALFLFRFVILCRSCSDLRPRNIKLLPIPRLFKTSATSSARSLPSASPKSFL